MPERFPRPSFDALIACYETDPQSIHECPFTYSKNPITVNTCALRLGEALSIANGLVGGRSEIEELTAARGSGKGLLLGKYGYAANLCTHGISRGARDLADFLRQQWGSPTFSWEAQADEHAMPAEAQGLTGVIAFIKLPGFSGQGHVDLWNRDGPVGHSYWNAQKIYLWRLD